MATTTKITIKKNVPIPTKERKSYPFEGMEKGDSFDAGEYTAEGAHSVYNSMYHYVGKKENSKKKFICRKVDGRIMVWRTK